MPGGAVARFDIADNEGEWNDDGRYWLIVAWLKEKHNGFCNQVNRRNWRKLEAQITRAVK